MVCVMSQCLGRPAPAELHYFEEALIDGKPSDIRQYRIDPVPRTQCREAADPLPVTPAVHLGGREDRQAVEAPASPARIDEVSVEDARPVRVEAWVVLRVSVVLDP